MSEKSAILFVPPYSPTLEAVIGKLQENPQIEAIRCASSLEAASTARKVPGCLILCHVPSEEDLFRHLTMQRLLKTQIAKKTVRLLATTSMKNDAVIAKIANQLGAEVIREPIQEKSLLFKIDRYLKALPRTESAESRSRAPGASEAVAAAPIEDEKNSWDPPLELESDCWSFGGKKAPSRAAGRWTLRLFGPPPICGSWQERDLQGAWPFSFSQDAARKSGDDKIWEWVPIDPENDPFIKEQGSWFFHGKKPDFQKEYWLFVGRRPELCFCYENESYGAKIRPADANANSLVLSTDSSAAGKAFNHIGALLSKPQVAQAMALGAAEANLRMTPPLEIESDCWLLQNRKPYRVGRRWSIALSGPTPESGRWALVETKSAPGVTSGQESEERLWQWLPQDPENDPFIKEEGAWLFRGIAPKFSGETWAFVGVKPELSFHYEGESYGSKFRCDEKGVLHVAKDSKAALQAMNLIEATLHRMVSVVSDEKQDTQEQKDSELRLGGKTRAEREKSEEESEVLLSGKKQGDGAGAEGHATVGSTSESELDAEACERDVRVRGASLEEAEKPAQDEQGDPASGQTSQQRRGTQEKICLVPMSEFGELKGEWLAVSTGTSERSWYAYVPIDLAEQKISSARELPRYWVYFGRNMPQGVVTEGSKASEPDHWSFLGQPPQSFDRFGELDPVVQKFFMEFFPDREKNARPPSVEAERPETQDLILEKEPERNSDDYAFSEETREGTELNYEDKAKPTASPELSITQPRVDPSAPSLSPIALTILVAELSRKREIDRRRVGERYCDYLSASLGGLRVELWVQAPGGWFCGGASDGTSGELGSVIAGVSEPQAGMHPSGALVVPVEIKNGALKKPVGAIIISGNGVGVVPMDYARAAARAVVGLVSSLAA